MIVLYLYLLRSLHVSVGVVFQQSQRSVHELLGGGCGRDEGTEGRHLYE